MNDAAAAEAIVAEAVKRRLGDPRRADRLAARLAVVRDERARIEAEITALEASADNLAAKTVTWSVDRVDKAMEPILNKLQKLRAKRDALEVPDDPHAAMRDAAREWDQAEAAGDIAALRAMVRRAFPNLTSPSRLPGRAATGHPNGSSGMGRARPRSNTPG